MKKQNDVKEAIHHSTQQPSGSLSITYGSSSSLGRRTSLEQCRQLEIGGSYNANLNGTHIGIYSFYCGTFESETRAISAKPTDYSHSPLLRR